MRITKTIPFVALTLLFLACDKDEPSGSVDDLSEFARNYLSLTMGAPRMDARNTAAGPGNIANESFQRLYNYSNAGGRLSEDAPKKDTVVYDYPYYQTCAQITNTLNADGSTTTVYDYGEGCNEGFAPYLYFMKGKYGYTYKNTFNRTGSLFSDTYSYSYFSENYGGTYRYDNVTYTWSSDANSKFQGWSEYDTALQTYRGAYTSVNDDTYTYSDMTYQYKGTSKASYSHQRYTLEESNYTYKTNDDYYSSTVLEPLVMRYDCYHSGSATASSDVMIGWFPTYVSGREFIRYKQGDQQGSFEINYGNGTCDNKIIIIENGRRIEVDLTDTKVYAL